MKDGVPSAPPRGRRKWRWSALDFASLDFEATGLDFERDTIISFGIVPISQARIDVGGSVYELVDPGDVAPSPESVTVHGLRPVDLRGAPPLAAARAALAAGLDGRYLVTWWAPVEAALLAKVFGLEPKSWMKRAIDVRNLVLALEPRATGITLTGAAEKFGVPVASPHHALDDALVTAQLFLVTASRLAAGGRASFRDLQRVGPATPPVLTRPRAPM
jgi:DNA polymerase III subunit epsilon